MKTSDPKMHLADTITACILIVVSALAAHHSYLLPRTEGLNSSPYSAAGLVPGLLSLALLTMASIMLARAVRGLIHKQRLRQEANGKPNQQVQNSGGPECLSHTRSPRSVRVTTVIGITLLLPVLLLPVLPFWLACFLFISLFTLIFEWSSSQSRLRTIAYSLITAGVSATLMVVIFERLLLMQLP